MPTLRVHSTIKPMIISGIIDAIHPKVESIHDPIFPMIWAPGSGVSMKVLFDGEIFGVGVCNDLWEARKSNTKIPLKGFN